MVIKKLAIILLCLLTWPSAAVQVISHSTIDVEQLSTTQIRRIYSMKQHLWPNGLQVKVFVLPKDTQAHKNFSKEVLRFFPYQLERMWDKLTYSGMGSRPIVVDDIEQMLLRIRQTPGAIGYVENIDIPKDVKVVSIVK